MNYAKSLRNAVGILLKYDKDLKIRHDSYKISFIVDSLKKISDEDSKKLEFLGVKFSVDSNCWKLYNLAELCG